MEANEPQANGASRRESATPGTRGFPVCIRLPLCYNTFFIGAFGATPGKMALKLRVLRSGGDRLSYRRSFCRHLAELLSSAMLLLGYVMALFDDERRTLHDRICDTRVVLRQDEM